VNLKDIITKEYNRKDLFQYLHENIFDIEEDISNISTTQTERQNGLIKKTFIAKATIDTAIEIGFYEFEVDSINKRAYLHKNLSKEGSGEVLEAVIAIYINPNDKTQWKLSFINLENNTPYNRYSYLLGVGIAIKTPLQQLGKLNINSSLEDITNAFSVETLNKEFYSGVFDIFEKMENKITYPSTNNEDKKEFIVRLIGRILFMKFLEKKEIIPSSKFEVKDNYYHQVLEPIFYETLNKPINERINQDDNNIPFLNGGLFDAHKNDFYDFDTDLKISKNINTLKIDDEIFTEFYKHLSQYNFTIDENNTTDIEVSLDPELLGLVFENLLASLNPETETTARKNSGSYYTPRQIVNYMVKSSIDEYLKDFDNSKHLEALKKIKVLDPACGSGAYPMGILSELVNYRQNLGDKTPLYNLKKEIIQNNIFGIDIQPIAIEISKLRFFLSLIVDEEKSNIEPLPNLEFKFVCANSLLALEKQTNLFNTSSIEDELRDIKKEYFYSTNKKELKEKFYKKQKDLQDELGLDFSNQIADYDPFNPTSVAKFFDSEYMFQENSFDIVIGNPPYIRQEKIKELKEYINSKNKQRKKDKQSPLYSCYNGTADIYVYFYELGYQLLKKDGILSYITSNKYTRAKYGKELRNFILSNSNIIEYIDFSGIKVFESATVDTSIMTFRKSLPTEVGVTFSYTKVDDKYKLNQELNEFISHNKIDYNQSDLTIDTFSFSTQEELKIKKQIEKIGTPLKEWDVNIYRGILTGFNEAFIIDGKTKDELIAKDPKSAEIIKPLLRGRDIKRYSYQFADLWLINSHNGNKKEDIEPIDINDYLSIKEHLDKFEPKLSRRSDKGDTPYNLRNCAYLEEFEKEKIVWNPVSGEYFFTFIKDEIYFNNSLFMITGDNLKYILSLMNCKLNKWLIIQMTNLVETGQYAYGSKDKIELLPIPKISEEKQKTFEDLVDQIMILKEKNQDTKHLEDKIDSMVYKLYGLSEDDIRVVEGVN
jgi:type II restriction/modification system DNA methylase subunit YeeA